MQRLLLLFVVSCCSAFASAQSVFAPIGAVWHHNAAGGMFRTTVVKDTVVQGDSCRMVVQQAGIEWNMYVLGYRISDGRTLYLKNTDDTVFLFNEYKNSFTPLYIFNVAVGDTIKYPVIPPEHGFLVGVTDSFYSVVVDSVRMVKYDTSLLETVYTHSIFIPDQAEMSYEGGYARGLGNIKMGLLPACNSCAYPLGGSRTQPQELRCYSDTARYVKLVTDDCAKGIKVSVNSLAGAGADIEVYPTPASHTVYFSCHTAGAQAINILLTDAMGRMVYRANKALAAGKSTIPVSLSGMAQGVYMYTITYANDMPMKTGKVVKM